MSDKKQLKHPETIITSHVNSDFDSVASMLAAQKLYPNSLVIFPGSQEKSLRDFFISSTSYLINVAHPDTIDFSTVERLVLVDTRQKKRIPPVITSHLIDQRSNVTIHIYDHHPRHGDDLIGSLEVCEDTGATVTILTQMLREKEIDFSEEEATIMALGIYEDTGSFTFSSTTEADFHAAAFLLTKGANLSTISDLMVKEIRADQITWLNALISEMICHRINGVDIHISTISSSAYIPNLATIVQKLMKIEELDTLFAVVLMENKINVVARSRMDEADVGKILSDLGGGGHPYAASAKISDKTLAQVEQELLDILEKRVHGQNIVNELISSPPILIDATMPCREASRIMTRYDINSLLIFKGDRHHIVGFISRQVIEKTLYHKLDHLPVREYMNTEFATISPEAQLPEIEHKIIDGKQRVLPVIDKNKVIGVVTRTDLFNYLVSRKKNKDLENPDMENSIRHAKKRNILPFINERLDKNLIALLKEIGHVGDQMNLDLYVVGGFVRDLMLYRDSDDIDVVVEGDGIAFACHLARLKQGRCNTHREFGTAVVILPNGFKIDVASARLEYYKSPAALPTVEMSSIKLDLFRRDFTINTLAICLNSDGFGTLIDFFGAQRDLKDKTIRIIHNHSFVEDPTRIFRAIKFANRFDFAIGKLTANLIQNAVRIDFFKALSGRRVFSEIKQILEEEDPISAIQLIKAYHLDKVIHPELILDKTVIALMESVKKTLAWHDLLYLDPSYQRWAVYFMVMLKRCPVRVAHEICAKFKLAPRHKNAVIRDRLRADDRLYILERKLPCPNSFLYNLLSIFKTEQILYIMATAKKEKSRKAISFYYTQLKDTEISVRGKDLVEMGMKPGPEFKDILQKILEAKLDGRLKSRDDELTYLKELHHQYQ